MIVDDHEISIREPAVYEANTATLFDSDSFDDESEPENESTAYWRAERLAREEFIDACILYVHVCMLEL